MNYNSIIPASTLATALGDPDVASSLLVIDCRFSLADAGLGRMKYKEGHLPGAYYAHLDDDLAAEIGPWTGRHPLPEISEFTALTVSWGVQDKTQVVIYDDAGGAIAARLWWMMNWIGHHTVAVLDGGFPAWERGGYKVTTELPDTIRSVHSLSPVKTELPRGRMPWIDVSTLERQLESGEIALFDARARSRFAGEHEPLDTIAGHVPGSVCLPFEENLDGNGCFLPAAQLGKRFGDILDGVEGSDCIVHMCGSGVTACHNILAMKIAGIQPTTLYVGSWSEWITDPDRVVATGN